ncbi:hypothetical protein Val02_13930 [Virgisporangium aliadipatigenens]|uniref:Uncharacterized protein n=1 Tax=Virgisporangium aliadipatigenens TaxID=741659 RepID=A0A8J3YHG3_9ACTN|nr:hypothetical protein [Virgisporangium aliadipatigenens]GIJ44507.1 hypothetical protein Val02_13930 [Virgisporangium aliadipatigenens]
MSATLFGDGAVRVWTVVGGVVSLLGLLISVAIVLGTADQETTSGVFVRDRSESQNDAVSSGITESSGADIAGTWKGEYRCAQGLTGLTLIIFVVDRKNARATFEFYPLPSNPSVPRGSFALKGTYFSTGISLEPDYWIHQPAGYMMLGLSLGVSRTDPPRISGDLPMGCHRLEVVKVSDETRPPPT